MSSQSEKMRKFTTWYRGKHGKTAVSMSEVTDEAIKMGWKIPPPVSGKRILEKQFAGAQREEIRRDKKTKEPYRGNLALTERQKDGSQRTLWVDTDEANRFQMDKALKKYRDQMLGEAVIGTNTAEHWNRTHPSEQPVLFPLDLADEIQWRKNAPDEGAA